MPGESKMKKIYLVTSGYHSDYSVDAAFSARELAEEYIKSHADYDYERIEEHDIDIDYPKLDNGLKRVDCFRLSCDINFNIETEYNNEEPIYRLEAGFDHFTYTNKMDWFFEAHLYDIEKAKKVLAEKAIQILSQGLWGKEEECKKLFGRPVKQKNAVTKYDIWMQGYCCSGMEGIPAKAEFLSSVEAHTFQEAVDYFFYNTDHDYELSEYDSESLRHWGCKIFDNEADARRKFG